MNWKDAFGRASMKSKRWAIRKCCPTRGFFRDIFHQAMEDSSCVEKGDVALIGVNVAHDWRTRTTLCLREISTSKIETWHGHTKEIEQFRRQAKSRYRTRCVGLDSVAAAVTGSDNLIPPVIEALDASATIGEIVTTMRRALGMPRHV